MGGEQLGRRDDRAPVVRRVELDVEWDTRLNRDSVLQMDRIHAARELEAEVSRGIDARLAAGRFRACESRRALGDKRPVVAKRVRVAGGVAGARRGDDPLVWVCEKGFVGLKE